MKLLSGKEPAELIKRSVKDEILQWHHNVSLVIMKVGDDPASKVYVRNKVKACEFVGIACEVWEYDKNIYQGALIDRIRVANSQPDINGILIQLPLPAHISEHEVVSAIDPIKDVAGLHAQNVGKLVKGLPCLVSCTPNGILGLLNYYQIPVEGKHCVIVGRSNIVGKPMAHIMLEKNATVTICHSRTKNLREICKQADILICAIGKPNYFGREYVKDGAVVIDVGINRDQNGKLCGDVDFDDVKDIVSAISPVPGGVGLMTVASLMANCLMAAENQEAMRWA